MIAFFESLRIALTAVWANRVRSVLTMLGIVIGVFAVITLVSIGAGVQKEFTTAVDDLGGNLGAVISGDIKTGNVASFLSLSSLTLVDAEAMKSVPGIMGVVPMMIVPGTITPPGGEPYQPFIVAVNEQIDDIVNFEIVEGRFISSADMDAHTKVLVIGRTVAEEYFHGDAVGKTLSLLNENFTVIGVVETDNELLGGGESGKLFGGSVPNLHEAYYTPIATIEGMVETLNIFRILYAFDTTEHVVPGVEQIEARLLSNHKGIRDFSVLTTDDMLDIFSEFFGILTNAVAGIAAISLLVGGIGIMNIMLVSVTERTREIGLRKAVGASNGNILSQFLIEAAAISVLGGAIGFGLSFLATKALTATWDIPTDITLSSVFVAVIISLGVGVAFGLAPAVRASRLNPIDALRYE